MVLARRFGLSAYDAAYLELADRLQCALLTNDREVQVAAEALGIPLS
jgi:predicted nucleic acid-binding protein